VRLYLFDIDGTLLRAGGAGQRALEQAFLELYGIPDAYAGVDFRGALDDGLLVRVHREHGLPLDGDIRQRFKARFAQIMGQAMDPGRYPEQALCPGVVSALDALGARGALGLVTGNWRVGARAKLEAFGLWERFALGAFSEDGQSRTALVAAAMAQARTLGLAFDRAVMIGDTPQDILAARQAGALAVGVRTGWSSPEELRAAGPDLLLSDLGYGLAELRAL